MQEEVTQKTIALSVKTPGVDCRRVKKYAAEVSVRTEAKGKESLQGWKTVIQRTEKPGFWFIQY